MKIYLINEHCFAWVGPLPGTAKCNMGNMAVLLLNIHIGQVAERLASIFNQICKLLPRHFSQCTVECVNAFLKSTVKL